MALQIPTRAVEHAQIGGYGLRWASKHVRDLGAISTLIRVEIASRSRACFEAT